MMQLWHNGLLRRATIDAIVVGALCGAVGVHVVLRKLPFFTASLAHASFPGIVLADLLGLPPLLGALVVAWSLAAVMGTGSRLERLDDTNLVGVLLAGTFGLGVLLQSLDDHPSRQLSAVLTGSVLGVDWAQVLLTAITALSVAAVMAGVHKEIVLTGFDPVGARAMGYGTGLQILVLGMVATTVVATIPAVGTVLTVALLTAPALAARCWVDRIASTMVLAGALGAASAMAGMWLSYEADLAAGASITLVTGAVLAISAMGGRHGVLRTR
jgi:ABC-type Mn2+/Zn2+ transport system permease subunit